MSTHDPVLVTGATGNQGNAVARHLLGRGIPVRALTRSPDSKVAGELAGAGAEVVKGDFDDAESLERALKGVRGVFSVQNMFQIGVERERAQGIALAEAAARAGARHLVYSSVGGADRNTGIGHFESKWAIEERIRSLGLPATILRPVFFLDNLIMTGMFGSVTWGAVAGALRGGKKLQIIVVDDIGGMAALAFAEPDRFLGRAIEIAGDEVSMDELRAGFREAKRRVPFHIALPPGLLKRMDKDLGSMFAWFRTDGYQADIPAVRALYPELHDLRTGLPHARIMPFQRAKK